MKLQAAEAAAYMPRSEIISELDQLVSGMTQLDVQRGLAIYRLLFKLRNCRGEEAVKEVETSLRALERKIAEAADESSVRFARETCLRRIRSLLDPAQEGQVAR